MISNLRKILFILRDLSLSKFFLSFYWNGYLSEVGWINSFKKQRSLNKDNEPIPWVTYSFIEFIKPRLSTDMVMLEYGSGNSTLFYSQFVKKVYAVEHDLLWLKELSAQLPVNAELIHKALDYGGKYANSNFEIDISFDIIVVDGRDRVNCIRQSVSTLNNGGVIVLDDSERSEYQEGIDFLITSEFKKIDFWGIAPGIFFNKCTTVFYKKNNCLNI